MKGGNKMKNYINNIRWAVFTIIDRSTQDDRKTKVMVEALFQNPVQAEEYILNAPNKEVRCFVLRVENLEEFERFYNFIQDLNEKYGEYAIYHIEEGNFSTDQENAFRTILDIWTDTKLKNE